MNEDAVRALIVEAGSTFAEFGRDLHLLIRHPLPEPTDDYAREAIDRFLAEEANAARDYLAAERGLLDIRAQIHAIGKVVTESSNDMVFRESLMAERRRLQDEEDAAFLKARDEREKVAVHVDRIRLLLRLREFLDG